MGLSYLKTILSEARQYLHSTENQSQIDGYIAGLLDQKNSLIKHVGSKNKMVQKFSKGVETLVMTYSSPEKLTKITQS